MRYELRLATLFLACVIGLPQASVAQVNLTTPGLFNTIGIGSPGAGGGEDASPGEGAAPPPGGGAVTPPPPPPEDEVEKVVTPPPPPPPEAQLEVYVAVNGQTTGPFNAGQLRAKVLAGELTGDTYVWMDGMAEWKRAREVPELAPILAAAPEKPDFDAVAFLSGSWESDPQQMQVPGAERAEIRGTIEYRRDGSFEGFGTLSMTAQGFTQTMGFTMSGTFKTQNASAEGFFVTQDGNVTYQTPTGPLTETVSTAFKLTILDQDTVTTDDGTRSRRIR